MLTASSQHTSIKTFCQASIRPYDTQSPDFGITFLRNCFCGKSLQAYKYDWIMRSLLLYSRPIRELLMCRLQRRH